MTTLTIDPGVERCGQALFNERGVLLTCAWLSHPLSTHADFAVLEVPQVYPNGRGDPNDLIDVAVAGGILIGKAMPDHIRYVRPREWKGTVNPDVMLERILSKLSKDERRIYDADTHLVPASKRHNVIDSIGIGLYVFERL